MSHQTRRRYTDEFKAETVSLVEEQGYGFTEAARRFKGRVVFKLDEHMVAGGDHELRGFLGVERIPGE